MHYIRKIEKQNKKRQYLKPIIVLVELLSAQMSKMCTNDFIYDGHFGANKSFRKSPLMTSLPQRFSQFGNEIHLIR